MQSYPNKYLDICLYVLKVSMEKKKKKMTLGFLLIIFIFENDPRMVERVYLKEPDCESMWLHFKVKRHINFHCNLKQKRNKCNNIAIYLHRDMGRQKKESPWSVDAAPKPPLPQSLCQHKGVLPWVSQILTHSFHIHPQSDTETEN